MDTRQKIVTYTVLLLWLAAVVLPLLWIGVNSLRSSREFAENPFGVPWLITGSPYADEAGLATPEEAAISNYKKAWTDSHFSQFFLNSVIVVSASLVGIIGFGAMAAYVLAKFRFPGNKMLYLFFISGMMIPAQLILIPLFFQFSTLSQWGNTVLNPVGLDFTLHNSLTGLTILYIALSLPFTILILTGFFKSLPSALRESAIIDGAGEVTVFWRIMLPLARPGLVTAAIFNFLGLWNEYLFALVFVNPVEKNTLPLGLASISIQSQYKTDYGLLFAGLVIVLVPTLIVYMLLQRQLTRGISMGALKG
ncbi:MAG: sugar ABC transporter permease [Candidatus Hydrogenedentota bacterium]|nr:MAG: sugar ABC transporter permease [Candidatus Hydrogenedentota bacterium]